MVESLEQEARRLRDVIYGQPPHGRPTTDSNWAACGEAWMQDIDWLRERVAQKEAAHA